MWQIFYKMWALSCGLRLKTEEASLLKSESTDYIHLSFHTIWLAKYWYITRMQKYKHLNATQLYLICCVLNTNNAHKDNWPWLKSKILPWPIKEKSEKFRWYDKLQKLCKQKVRPALMVVFICSFSNIHLVTWLSFFLFCFLLSCVFIVYISSIS